MRLAETYVTAGQPQAAKALALEVERLLTQAADPMEKARLRWGLMGLFEKLGSRRKTAFYREAFLRLAASNPALMDFALAAGLKEVSGRPLAEGLAKAFRAVDLEKTDAEVLASLFEALPRLSASSENAALLGELDDLRGTLPAGEISSRFGLALVLAYGKQGNAARAGELFEDVSRTMSATLDKAPGLPPLEETYLAAAAQLGREQEARQVLAAVFARWMETGTRRGFESLGDLLRRLRLAAALKDSRLEALFGKAFAELDDPAPLPEKFEFLAGVIATFARVHPAPQRAASAQRRRERTLPLLPAVLPPVNGVSRAVRPSLRRIVGRRLSSVAARWGNGSEGLLSSELREFRYLPAAEMDRAASGFSEKMARALGERLEKTAASSASARGDIGAASLEALGALHAMHQTLNPSAGTADLPQTEEVRALLRVLFENEFDLLPPIQRDFLKRFGVRPAKTSGPDPADSRQALALARLLMAFGKGLPAGASDRETALEQKIKDLMKSRRPLTGDEARRLEAAYQKGWVSSRWAQQGRHPWRIKALSRFLQAWEAEVPAQPVVKSYDLSGLAETLRNREPLSPREMRLVRSLQEELVRRASSQETTAPLAVLSNGSVKEKDLLELLRTQIPSDLWDVLRDNVIVLSGGEVRSGFEGLMDPDRVLKTLEKRLGVPARAEIFTDDVERWKKDWRSAAKALLIEVVSEMEFRIFRSSSDMEAEFRHIQLLQIQA